MNRALDPELKRWMVKQAETIANKASASKGQKSQLHNLVQITRDESEVSVLENFLQYQAGRRATSKFWKPIHQEVIAALKEIERRTTKEAEAKRRLAIQSFFGYVVRRYVYMTSVGSRPSRAAGPGNQAQGGGRSR